MSGLQVHFIATDGVDALPPTLAACLPAAERQRALALCQPQDRINRMTAYAALFKLAARHAGLPVQTLELQRSAHGKPQLRLPPGHPPLHASLSHSGTWVVIALANGPVGIDIERLREFDWHPLRRAHFAGDAWPRDIDPTLAFHQLWCSKEAVLKATGDGLRVPLAQVHLRAPRPCFQPLRGWPEGSPLAPIKVCLLNAPSDYVGAVAMANPPAHVTTRRLRMADLH